MEVPKEQAEALQEKLKNMSPEELRAFQKQQCIFCHIISGKVAAKKVYEDERCIALLDINPANPGHVILVPKEHYSIMPLVNDEEIAHLFMVAKHLSHALLRALKAEGTNIFVANGVVAGQRAQHMMIHIIPRKENDGLNLTIPKGNMSEDDLDRVRKMLMEKIAETMGTAQIEEKAEEKPVIKETKKRKPIVLEADFKEEKKPETTIKQFVKSQSSNKYHLANCPFAKRIKKKIYLTKEQTKGLEPCTCTDETPVKIKTQKKDAKTKEKEVNLDDIADLLGAKK